MKTDKPTPSGGTESPGIADPQSAIRLPQSRFVRLAAYRLLLTVAAAVFFLDRLTKAWIVARLPFETYGEANGAIPVSRGFFYLVHVGNTGAAWSLLTGRSVLLALLAALTLLAIVVWRRALGLRERMPQVCFGLLCGGIVGNLVDRLLYHHVIDFIDLHFGSYVYPTFNIADSGICVGVILYILHSLRTPQ